MYYSLKQNDGNSVKLAFSNYFLCRYANLSNTDFQGCIENLEIVSVNVEDYDKRLHIIMASMDAAKRLEGNFEPTTLLEAETCISNIQGGLNGFISVWNSLFEVMLNALFPQSLGKETSPTKGKAKKSNV